MTALEGAVVYEELGRALAPTPHFVSCVVARRARWSPAGPTRSGPSGCPGSPWARRSSRPRGWSPAAGSGPGASRPGRSRDDAGWILTGAKRHVAFASAATRLLVLARTGDGDEDVDLFLVDPDGRRRHA